MNGRTLKDTLTITVSSISSSSQTPLNFLTRFFVIPVFNSLISLNGSVFTFLFAIPMLWSFCSVGLGKDTMYGDDILL